MKLKQEMLGSTIELTGLIKSYYKSCYPYENPLSNK